MTSDTADNVIWDRYTRHAADTKTVSALSRITFSVQDSAQPLHTVIDLVKAQVTGVAAKRNLVVLAGRSRRMAVESHKVELQELITEQGSSIGSSVPKTLGDVGAALVAAGTTASLLILQAAVSHS